MPQPAMGDERPVMRRRPGEGRTSTDPDLFYAALMGHGRGYDLPGSVAELVAGIGRLRDLPFQFMADVLDPPPEPTAADKMLEVAHSVASELPGAGTVVEILRQLFGTPYQRRQETWMRALYDLVLDLEQRGYDVAELLDRPEFVTAVHDASRIAIGEHLEEKLEMLKAVLFHAATSPPDPLTDIWTLRYLRWVDELEPQHVHVLRFSADPRGCLTAAGRDMPEFMTSSRRTVLDLADLPFGSDQVDLVLEDLRDRKLADLGTGMVTKNAVYRPWITDRGARFLEWLTIV